MKNLNMFIPILMHYCSLISNCSVASRITQQNCDVINDKQTISCSIPQEFFDITKASALECIVIGEESDHYLDPLDIVQRKTLSIL